MRSGVQNLNLLPVNFKQLLFVFPLFVNSRKYFLHRYLFKFFYDIKKHDGFCSCLLSPAPWQGFAPAGFVQVSGLLLYSRVLHALSLPPEQQKCLMLFVTLLSTEY